MTTSGNASGGTPQHYLDGHALVRPDKVALICGDRSLKYAELNARARRVSFSKRSSANRIGKA